MKPIGRKLGMNPGMRALLLSTESGQHCVFGQLAK
jgi:hypothetical protein